MGELWTEDRLAGIGGRDHVAGVRLWHRVIDIFASQSLTIFIQIGSMLGILCGLHGMVIKGSWILVVGLIYLASLTGLSIGRHGFVRYI